MRSLAAALALFPAIAVAQAPEPTPAAASTPSPPVSAASESRFLGKDVPFLDPANEILAWDGRNWNITNNRLFEARFEKFLNAAEETTEADREYQSHIRGILDLLAPANISTRAIDQAFQLLPKASGFPVDARLCDALADAVYSAWKAQAASARLANANEALEAERKRLEWNAKVAGSGVATDAPPSNKDAVAEWERQQALRRDLNIGPYTTRLAEVLALVKANQVKKELSELQTKIEFQALIVQFFLQRRFQHVLMATRFYRATFTDGATKLELDGEAKDLFAKSSGLPPTIGTLDSLANEAIRDAREGVEAYLFLLSKNEVESATKRLAEAFAVGEYLPELRTLPRDQKRVALAFARKSNQLVSALEVRDFALAESLLKDLGELARDFDPSKPAAAIETARTVSAMHLAKARNAAVSGDRATLEQELKAATEIWPRNPALAEIGGIIFKQTDVQQQTLADLDRLISQKNYRQIFDHKIRFIAAAALYPEKQDRLAEVLATMEQIEGGIIRSTEIAKRGDYAGAWENIERVFEKFPDDSKLNQLRATLTTEAADFVRALRIAKQHEDRKEHGTALAWYLRAQKLYPASDFAKEGIERLSTSILPSASFTDDE